MKGKAKIGNGKHASIQIEVSHLSASEWLIEEVRVKLIRMIILKLLDYFLKSYFSIQWKHMLDVNKF